MTLLSIVVPVYNKSDYINETIDSILKQSMTDFELILVNDGSTDDSGAICDQYTLIDRRVKVIHQINQGVSVARNTGLYNCKGTYIGFVDSDDTIEPDMYELLINNAKLHNADISVCSIQIIHLNKLKQFHKKFNNIRIINNQEVLPLIFDGTLDWSANNKIYKSHIAKSVQFEGRINEDLLYVFQTHKQSNRIIFSPTAKYNYIKRENSISMQRFNTSQMESIIVSERILETTQKEYPEFIDQAKALSFVSTLSIFNLICISTSKEYKLEYDIIKKKLESYKQFVNKTDLLSQKHKLAYKFFTFNPNIYKHLLHLYCRLFQSEAGSKVA